MTMQRWALVRDGEVRGYLLHLPVVTEQDEDLLNDAKRRLVFGDDDDGAAPLEPEGEWIAVPESAGLVGDGWRYDGKDFHPREG
jgi:hypothetical protein